MANLGRMLGMLLATRMAGRGHFGTALGSAALLRGGRLGRTAGLASLGYMAYRAYQERKTREPDAAGQPDAASGLAEAGGTFQRGGIAGTVGNLLDSLTGGQTSSRRGAPGLGDKVASYLDPDRAGPANDAALAAPGGSEMDDGRALLLIRAMIAAANADGRISAEERRRIIAEIDAAGADAEDHRLIEQELDHPRPLEKLLAEVHDHDTAQQFYTASRTAMDGETPVQASYLEYLRHRLDLPSDEAAEIEAAMR